MANENQPPILSRLCPPPGAVSKRKRVGRGPGSGVGKTCGRGVKGQKSRSGGAKPARGFEGGQMPLMRRLPKFGFKNPFSKQVATVNIGRLAVFDGGSEVGPRELTERRLVRGRHQFVKILGEGELERALIVRAHAFSASAKEKIERAGGKAELIASESASADVAQQKG